MSDGVVAVLSDSELDETAEDALRRVEAAAAAAATARGTARDDARPAGPAGNRR